MPSSLGSTAPSLPNGTRWVVWEGPVLYFPGFFGVKKQWGRILLRPHQFVILVAGHFFGLATGGPFDLAAHADL